MPITLESVLEAAGIRSREDPVEVLRDGFPSYVVRVRSTAFPGNPTLIVKACPDASREPDVLLYLHGAGLPVLAILDIRQGDGFRAVILEDVGRDALYKHPDARFYVMAAEEIGRIHRWFEMSHVETAPSPALGLAGLLPRYGDAAWASVVRSAVVGTLRRLDDGTYKGLSRREVEALPDTL